ncbi:hypothetical protein [Actinomyces culturomici]|uniref:hypothetical protein n=1 Tax=Actinomyces culturomici TaxID=1926276 RepID=UPI000E20BBBC|nr:hypothetical protein [Actinomyces culturomici]
MDITNELIESPAPESRVRYRKGRYLEIPTDSTWWEKTRLIHTARLADACNRSGQAIAVLHSAVFLHGGALRRPPAQAHVRTTWHRKPLKTPGPAFLSLSARERRERLSRRPVVNHRMELDEDRLTVIDGIVTTDLLQTMEMAARFLPPDEALIALDSLLAIAADRNEYWRNERQQLETRAQRVLSTVALNLEHHKGERGYRQARQLLEVATPLSESPLESEVRRVALAAGYSAIEPQVEVNTRAGTKWVDLGIPGVARGLEANGEIKYEGEEGDSRRSKEAARREALADVGFRVRDLDARTIMDTPRLLSILDETFPEHRELHGRSALWTPQERRRFP